LALRHELSHCRIKAMFSQSENDNPEREHKRAEGGVRLKRNSARPARLTNQPRGRKHESAGGRHPRWVNADRLCRRESGQRHRKDNKGEQWGACIGDRDRTLRCTQVSSEESPEHSVFDADHRQPRQRHQSREPDEGESAGCKCQQVGQIRHRQQQGRGIGQVGTRIDMWAGSHAEPCCSRKDDRGEQDDGGVKAERRGDERCQHEHDTK
jgi:hypothetical protein